MGAIIKAVNRAYDRTETRPFWKVRLIGDRPRRADAASSWRPSSALIVFGGPLGEAIADNAGLGGAFEVAWGILRWPVAFVAILLFFALVYYLAPDTRQRNWTWVSPGSLVGGVALARALGTLRALHELRELVRQDVRLARRRHRPPALAVLLRPSRCSSAPSSTARRRLPPRRWSSVRDWAGLSCSGRSGRSTWSSRSPGSPTSCSFASKATGRR